MDLFSVILVFTILWWLCFFVVLPVGVQNAKEAGEVVQDGHEPGAPVDPQIRKKALWATYGAVVLTVMFALAMTVLAP